MWWTSCVVIQWPKRWGRTMEFWNQNFWRIFTALTKYCIVQCWHECALEQREKGSESCELIQSLSKSEWKSDVFHYLRAVEGQRSRMMCKNQVSQFFDQQVRSGRIVQKSCASNPVLVGVFLLLLSLLLIHSFVYSLIHSFRDSFVYLCIHLCMYSCICLVCLSEGLFGRDASPEYDMRWISLINIMFSNWADLGLSSMKIYRFESNMAWLLTKRILVLMFHHISQ